VKANSIIHLIIMSLTLSFSAVKAQVLESKFFSQLPNYSKLSLSPDGSQLAFIRNLQNPELSLLSIMSLSDKKQRHLVKSDNEDVRVNWFTWANNRTLIVSLRFATSRDGVDTVETRLVAIDTDAKEIEQRNLIKVRAGFNKSLHVSQFQDRVIDFLPDDPDHILIALDIDSPNQPGVYKLNIYTTLMSRISRGKLQIRDWMTDQQGNLRLGDALNYRDGEASLRVLIKPEDSTWAKLFEYNALEESGVTPLGFDLDPNILYYTAYQGDKKALFKINLAEQKSELVFADPDYDVEGSLIYSTKTRGVIGIRHGNSPNGRIYWDDATKKFQDALNNALPGMDNYLVDFSADENIYLLYSENDFTPGMYFIGNRKAASLDFLFEQYPGLTPEVLSDHKLVSYTARDGTAIEGYLTLPKGVDKPIATILHPHGGPGAREMDGFDYWTSFFSNQGYAVFRPNFRGSSGYGYKFAQSQMKGWGLTMQDDLTDATHWLIDEKIADPKRICIVGASYGGYAAAMAAVKTPDLFKCAISFAGVSDLKKLVNNSRRYTNSKFVKNQIGSDSDDLEARSPYFQAAKIKTPLLLLHGEDDRVVDVEQSRRFAEELEDLAKPVTYIEYANGDHYLSIQRNRHQVFEVMGEFLRTNLQ
jgi:dipeptidyl aminopeptidase/acylaminoacyl peptidase